MRLSTQRTEVAAGLPGAVRHFPLMGVASDGDARPSGTVTLLFTDVEGSTRLCAADKQAMSIGRVISESDDS